MLKIYYCFHKIYYYFHKQNTTLLENQNSFLLNQKNFLQHQIDQNNQIILEIINSNSRGEHKSKKSNGKNSIVEVVRDTRREKAASNKTPVLRKSRNMGIWVVAVSNQLFIRGYSSETKSSKK